MQAKTNHASPRRGRTRAEVLAARATLLGCCNQHCDNSACDCLAEAEQQECRRCGGNGRHLDAAGSVDQCDTCHGRGRVYFGGVGLDAEYDPACPACHGTGRAAP